MKINFFLVLLLMGRGSMAQCPDMTVNLTGTGNHCTGDTLTAHASGRISQIVWYNGGQVVKTVKSTITTSPTSIVAGGNGLGNAANQLYLPFQIFVDDDGSLYVADQNNGRVQKFPPGSTSATNGSTILQPPGILFGAVTGLYLDSRGNIYVLQGDDLHVEKWAPGATSGVVVATLTPTGMSTALGNLGPIFVDAAGTIYLPESGNNRVQQWAPGASTGITVAGGNGAGPAANQLNTPEGVYVDKAGNVYVADVLNSRIQKWAPGATMGVTVAGGNGEGSATNQLDHPGNLCLDDAGNMYIADCYNHRIQLWTPGATEGITIAGGKGPGDASDQLYYPVDVFLDNKGYLYISDSYNSRILKCLPSFIYTVDFTLVTDSPGMYTAVITSEGGCVITTNPIVIQPNIHPDLDIAASANPVCAGDSVVFAAAPVNTNLSFTYHWLVSGAPAGGNSPAFSDLHPSDGDLITCLATDEPACAVAQSNTVILSVNPRPEVGPGQVIPLAFGQSVILAPILTGDISHYSWSPATGLSDTTIDNPIADPLSTTQYTLQVTGSDGCMASGVITVKVFTQLRIPSAFTPNGDGKNDIFYVMGGPAGSVIVQFAVFNRWGQRVFQVHDVAPDDPVYGWNGYSGGSPSPTGVYVYLIEMKLGDGTSQVVKGTVMLVR